MADIHAPTPQILQGYGPGMFRISEIVHNSSVIVLPHRTIPWPVEDISQLDGQALAPALAEAPLLDILLLGTGDRMALPDRSIIEACRACSVVLEYMDTGAACRTYNLLAGEKRRVAAALIILP